MTSAPSLQSHVAIRIAGWSLIVAAVGFISVFSYLAAVFNYPDVLDGDAAQVLPKLLTLGVTGRAVWILYALLPLLLIPAGIGSAAALEESAPNAMRAAIILATLSAVSMLVGLARWPTLHWELAHAYESAEPIARVSMIAFFNGLNRYLGNFIGEFVGEFALNLFFILSGYALHRAQRQRLGSAGIVVGVVGLIASLRNVTSAVATIAEVNNYLLPLWLIALGVVFVRWSARAPVERALGASTIMRA